MTNIIYDLGTNGMVAITVYDLMGREIERLVNEYKETGAHEIVWDAGGYPSGMYFIEMIAGDYQVTQKLMLVK